MNHWRAVPTHGRPWLVFPLAGPDGLRDCWYIATLSRGAAVRFQWQRYQGPTIPARDVPRRVRIALGRALAARKVRDLARALRGALR